MSRFTLCAVALACALILVSAVPSQISAAVRQASPSPTPTSSMTPSSSSPPPGTGSTSTTVAPSGGGSASTGNNTEADASGSPEATPSDSKSKDDNACFPADATVTLESGAVISMADLAVGDRVHIGRGAFSDVFMFTHKMADVAHDFVSIESASGANLRLTSGHYIYVNDELSAAKTVKVGDRIELSDGSLDTVVSVAVVQGKGLYNPQTVEGDVVVDGIRASTYTSSVEPAFAHAVLSPLRALYRVLGWSSSALDNGSNAACLLPSGASVY